MEERQKRDTIFPGSDQWTGNRKVSKYPVHSREVVPSVPELPKRQKRRLIKLLASPSRKTDPVPLFDGSPLEECRIGYRLELGGTIAVIHTVPATEDLLTMHSFSSSGADKKLYMLRHLKHANLLASIAVFFENDTYYLISEHTEISCEELIVARPGEVQLAAIIHQIVDPLSYLVKQNLTHGAITCSNILLTKGGIVKIANWENCTKRSSEKLFEDVKALGQVMKQLMEMGTENGRLGLEQPFNWSRDAVNFLSLTLTASPNELAKHPFLKNSPQVNELCKDPATVGLDSGQNVAKFWSSMA